MNQHSSKVIEIDKPICEGIKIIEQFLQKEECHRHTGRKFSSICFGCRIKNEVFHCETCEEECKNENQHVNLCQLNESVVEESVIKNWPLINSDLLQRLQGVLSLKLDVLNCIKNEDLKEFDDEKKERIRQKQSQLQETYTKYSQQKKFRDIIISNFDEIEEITNQLLNLIIFTKKKRKQIAQEFDLLLNCDTIWDDQNLLLNINSGQQKNKQNEFNQKICNSYDKTDKQSFAQLPFEIQDNKSSILSNDASKKTNFLVNLQQEQTKFSLNGVYFIFKQKFNQNKLGQIHFSIKKKILLRIILYICKV